MFVCVDMFVTWGSVTMKYSRLWTLIHIHCTDVSKKVIHHRPIRFFTGSIYHTTKQSVFHHQWLGIFVLPLAPRDFVIAITKSSRFYISNAWELVWMPENNSCSCILFSQQKYDIMRWDIQFVYSLFLGEGWQGNMELVPILISDKTRDVYLELFDRSEIWQAPRQQCCQCAC